VSCDIVCVSQMLTALSAVAKQTALICNTCRSASEKSESASTKRNFVQLAKDIANGTAAVVQAVKVFTADYLYCLVSKLLERDYLCCLVSKLLECLFFDTFSVACVRF